MGSLVVRRVDGTAGELAARSRAWRDLAHGSAVLSVAEPRDEAIVLGSFQRSTEVRDARGRPILRRGSGGGVAWGGPGTIWVQLTLPRVDALVPCTADKILNRYVRPLLRAATRASNLPVNYFGRDWISAAHRPVALVGFAHDASTNQAFLEAMVAVASPVSPSERASFLGKLPATLEEVSARAIEPARVIEAIVEAYAAIAEIEAAGGEEHAPWVASVASVESPWSATREEVIGTVGAGRDASGKLRLGGEFMASHDAVARLEDLVATLPANASAEDVGRIVDEAFTTRGAVIFGVKSLTSLRDVLLEAAGLRD